MKQGQTKQTGGEILARAVSGYIEAHYREKFSLQKMARELYVNGSYMLRAFRKNTGFTPLAYHNHIRCERARELLADPERNVSEVGEAVGYASPAHFTHVFKKTTGCTPTEFRMRMKEGNNATANRIDKAC